MLFKLFCFIVVGVVLMDIVIEFDVNVVICGLVMVEVFMFIFFKFCEFIDLFRSVKRVGFLFNIVWMCFLVVLFLDRLRFVLVFWMLVRRLVWIFGVNLYLFKLLIIVIVRFLNVFLIIFVEFLVFFEELLMYGLFKVLEMEWL